MPQVINTVTKAAPTDNYAVVRDVDLLGSYRIVANLTERDAIVSAQRKQAMLVFVISDLHFYQLQSNLLTWTDLGLTLGGGFLPPIVRYVYLVQDASDALRMGGTANNTYTTFQTAYTAAITLQVALGGSNIVVIKVGNISAVASGNVTLTANWNRFVYLSGNGISDSVLGNIIATNAIGNGFGIGTPASFVNFSNIRIGNITTNATGATGNSGVCRIIGYNIQITTIDTSIINVTNVTGNGGNISLSALFNNGIYINTVITSSRSTTSSAGFFDVFGFNISVVDLTTANNNAGGDVIISPVMGRSSIQNINCSFSTSTSQFYLVNCNVRNINATLGNASYTMINSYVSTICNILNNGVGVSTLYITNCYFTNLQQFLVPYTTNAAVRTIARNTSFNNIVNLGDNSKLMVCSLNRVGDLTAPTIDGIGIGCIIKQCTIEDGNFSIDNPIPVTILALGTYLEFPESANITIA